MGMFQDAIYQLEALGVADVILPFILIFTIVFAVLQKSKVLGTDDNGRPRKNYNVVIGLVMGLAVVIPHVMGAYPSNDSDVVNIINLALPNISAVLVAVLMLLLIIGVFAGEVNFAGTSVAGWAVLFALAVTVIVFGAAANWFDLPYWLYFMNDIETQSLIVVILVFALIIWFITKEDKPKKDTDKNVLQQLGEVMKTKK